MAGRFLNPMRRNKGPSGYEPPRLCIRVPPYSVETPAPSQIRPRPLHLKAETPSRPLAPVGQSVEAANNWRRLWTPSFAKTDFRWSWTVCREMKSRSVMARVSSPGDDRGDDVTLAPVRCIGAAERSNVSLGVAFRSVTAIVASPSPSSGAASIITQRPSTARSSAWAPAAEFAIAPAWRPDRPVAGSIAHAAKSCCRRQGVDPVREPPPSSSRESSGSSTITPGGAVGRDRARRSRHHAAAKRGAETAADAREELEVVVVESRRSLRRGRPRSIPSSRARRGTRRLRRRRYRPAA